MTGQRAALRIALMVPAQVASRHVAALLEWAVGRDDLDINHLIIAGPGARSDAAIERRALRAERLRRQVFAAVIGLERRVLGLRSKTTWRVDRCSLATLVAHRVDVATSVPRTGGPASIDAADVERIERLELDLIICVGMPRLGGSIVRAARLGVIGVIDAADPDADPDGTALEGFWEVLTRAESTRFGVRLLRDATADACIARGACMTERAYLLNRASVVRKTFAQLRSVLARAARDGALPAASDVAPDDAGARLPGVGASLRYLVALLGGMAGRAVLRRLKIEQRWNVSYVYADWRNVDLRRARTMPWMRGRYLADPFVLERDGRTFLFVEDFVYRTGRGHISVFELLADGPRELGICLQEPFHLSFPFLFEFEGNLYMCPETNEAREVRVYRCDEFPLRWSLAAVLMHEIVAADPVLFERDGRWWLLLNRDYAADGDLCWALDIYSADSPLSNKWIPHPLNPVCTDSLCARNGGFLVEGTRRFRPAQRQGFNLYGLGLSIFEIELIAADDYRERQLRVIKPDFRPGLIGVHHMTSTGHLTVVDHLSWSYIG
jgi:hypothetical protein